MSDRQSPVGGFGHARSAANLPPSRAILLRNEELSTDDRNLATLLDFFGIPWKAASPREIVEESANNPGSAGGYCLLSAAPILAEALGEITALDSTLPPWLSNASSVYLFNFR